MPPKKGRRKPRPKKMWQKILDFADNYKKVCELYDVKPIETIEEVYRPLIVKKSKKLPQILQFADMEVHPNQIRPLIEAFKQAEIKVRIFSFLQTESGDEGLHVLAHLFDPPLEIVGLAYHANDVGPSGCRALARAMVTSKFLSILELDFNRSIGDDGAIGLTHYGHCPTLSRLSLKFCEIGDNGAIAIGKWIASGDCHLKEIFLNGNRIGPKGAIGFAEGLGQNRSLNRVELNDNVFGYDLDAMNALYEGIKANPEMKYVNLLNNFECPEGIPEKFLDLVKEKPLGECVLTVKMNSQYFQNIKAFSLINKRKMIKEAKRLAREARKNRNKSPSPPPADAPAAAPAAAAEAPVTTEQAQSATITQHNHQNLLHRELIQHHSKQINNLSFFV